MPHVLRILVLVSALVVVHMQSARGDEVIQLLDNTKITGTFVHYFDGLLTVKLPNGTDMKLPASKIKQISFALPKPRADFSTPEKTFQRLRKAALKGDLLTYADCHSTFYQLYLDQQMQLAPPGEFVKQLKKQLGEAQLEVVGTKIKGNTAVMKIRRSKGGDSEEAELPFIKENGEWKAIIIPYATPAPTD